MENSEQLERYAEKEIKGARRVIISYAISLMFLAVIFIEFIFPLTSFTHPVHQKFGNAVWLLIVGYAGIWFLFVEQFIASVKNYRFVYKEYAIKGRLAKYFKNIQFDNEDGLKEEDIDDCGFFPPDAIFFVRNHIMGTYKGYNFEQSDVEVRDSVDKKAILFLGRIILLQFVTFFKGRVEVIEKSNRRHKYCHTHSDNLIKTNNQVFDEKFEVYSEDKELANQILIPKIMEKILEFSSAMEGNLALMFVDGDLFIALNDNKETFKKNNSSRLDDLKLEDKIQNEFKFVDHAIQILDNASDKIVETKRHARLLSEIQYKER